MVSDRDIYRTARLLIRQRGPNGASDHAARRIAALRDAGDEEGARTWGRIRAALLDLGDARFRDDTVH